MDTHSIDFILIFVLILIPPMAMQIIYTSNIYSITGRVINAPDFDTIYYKSEGYAPLTVFLARVFDRAGGNVGLIFFMLLITTIIPTMLITHLTKNFIPAIVYLFGTSIPTFYTISATFPQALVVVLMLSAIAWPKHWWVWLVLAFFTHTFGVPAIILAHGVSIWRNSPELLPWKS